MPPISSRQNRTGLKTKLYHFAECCWRQFRLRKLYALYAKHANRHYHRFCRFNFYENILLFRRYFKYQETARRLADSPPGTADPDSGPCAIDYGKIKSLGGVSLKYYEPSAFRVGAKTSKAKIGVPLREVSWGNAPDPADTPREAAHSRCCLIIPRVTTQSFALQLLHIFTCFLYLRELRQQGDEPACLLLDSGRDKLSELYTVCLPDCRFPKEFEGIHRFQRLIFAPLEQDWAGLPWRQMLLTCGLADEFHRFVLSAFDIAPPEPIRRVSRITLIRRKKHVESGGKPCIDRVIKNEEEIIAALNDHYRRVEFQAAYFEKLSLREQLRLFTQSDILVSMHGAGLIVGAYFAPFNAGILELFPKYYRIPESALTCRAIAASRGLHYRRRLNHRKADEFGSDTQAGISRSERYYRNPVRQNSLTHIPVAAMIKCIDRLIRKIESAG